MKLVAMTFVNSNGKTIEKEVEERLASTYKAMGWKVKTQKSAKSEKFYEPTQSKRLEK